jgi:hypothetical protein
MKARLAVLACLLAAAGCGAHSESVTIVAAAPTPNLVVSATPASSPRPTPRPTNSPVPPPQSGPHFATPEAAMRYLASAWNRRDMTALKHVTDPAARQLLVDMYREAANLRLDHCTFTKARGDYECYFNHGFPKGYKSQGPVGHAELTVGPADRPGWYMTYFVSCGG